MSKTYAVCAFVILVCSSCAGATSATPLSVGAGIPTYSRTAFPHWSDLQPPRGCDTRSEILARDVDSPGEKVLLRDHNGCTTKVIIVDPYTGSPASNLDVDHVVSLYDAWYSGAYLWNRQQREQFANDPSELLAVSASSNRSKSSEGPGTWRPPDARFRCAYALAYRDIKMKWSLTISQAQQDALAVLLVGCV